MKSNCDQPSSMTAPRWIVAIVVGCIGVAVLAQSPREARSDAPRDARPERPARAGDESRGAPSQRPQLQALSPEEYERAMGFMREHMPTAFRIWSNMPEGIRERRVLPPRVAAALRLMFEAEDRDDDAMADLLARQMRLRDQFLGELIERRDAGENREQIREALREKVREIVLANLEQRELRLAQMERRLALERQNLEREKANPDLLLDRQIESIMEESRMFLRARFGQGGVAPSSPPDERAPASGDGARPRD